MKPQPKDYGERLSDLVYEQYGSVRKAAVSFGVSESTIYRRMRMEDAPSKAASRQLGRREYYYEVEKPRREQERRQEATERQPLDLSEFEEVEGPARAVDLMDHRSFAFNLEYELKEGRHEELMEAIEKGQPIQFDLRVTSKGGALRWDTFWIEDYTGYADFISTYFEFLRASYEEGSSMAV